ncbi:TPA: tagatose-6-phosphate kinase [Staphylococcus aureus]|nr:tagatose-6-phosphate kinase [Staphylococcus aureus]AND03446.1 hypothetical protein AB179_11710 [Staphylococcus aureus]
MNKHERLDEIAKLVNKKGTIRTNEIVEGLNVSDMTVRRDLIELENKGILTKIHGGARSNSTFQYKEISHKEKHTRQIAEKRYIARKAASLIEDGDTLFFGPGTTVELLAEEVNHHTLTIITNCLPVYKILLEKQTAHFRVYLIGGELGQFIAKKLDHADIKHAFYNIKGETRNCIAILHEGQQTEILEQGPEIDNQEAAGFIKHFEQLLEKVEAVAISGSLPKGLNQDYYAQIIERCQNKGVPVILDCSGATLQTVLENPYKPTVIKPNISELYQLLNQPLDESLESLKQAVSQPLFEGIEWIIVSLGAQGAFAKHNHTFYRVNIPTINVLNPVGSGDSTVAGITSAILNHENDHDLLKKANTLGMLNAQEAQTGYVNLNNYDELFNQIEVLEV